MSLWASIFMALLMAAGQVTLPGQAAAVACECSGCAVVQCCPCDSAPVAPISVPAGASVQLGTHWLTTAANSLAFTLPIQGFAAPFSTRSVVIADGLHLHKRNCVFLI